MNNNWLNIIEVKEQPVKITRAISFNEDIYKQFQILSNFLNRSLSETIEQLLTAYINHGEIKTLDGNFLKVKDIIDKGSESEANNIEKENNNS